MSGGAGGRNRRVPWQESFFDEEDGLAMKMIW